MKKINLLISCIIPPLLIPFAGISSCKGDLISVVLNENEVVLSYNQSIQLTATVFNDTDDLGVFWESSSENVTVSKGNVKVVTDDINCVGETVYITATSYADETKSATCKITIDYAREIQELSLSENSIFVDINGGIKTITASLSPKCLEPSLLGVNWTSSKEELVTVDNGKIQVVTTEASDIGALVTITATSKADESFSAECEVTIDYSHEISEIKLDCGTEIEFKLGESQQFRATVEPFEYLPASYQKVEWLSDSELIKIDENGLATVTTTSEEDIGKVITITAKSMVNPNKSVSCHVKLVNK